MATFREINDEVELLIQEAIDNDGEIDTEALEALEIGRREKLNSIGHYRVQNKADVKALIDEIKRLTAIKKVLENTGRGFDAYTLYEMARAGIRKFVGEFVTLSIRKSPMSAEVTINPDTNEPHIEMIDARFVEEVVEMKVKKADAIRHFKATGEQIDGFTFIDDKESLIVK